MDFKIYLFLNDYLYSTDVCRDSPGSDELLQLRCHLLRTDETQSADGDGWPEGDKQNDRHSTFHHFIKNNRRTTSVGLSTGTGAGLSVPVFSSRVFGVLGLLMISTR